jgi:hypothetical protein
MSPASCHCEEDRRLFAGPTKQSFLNVSGAIVMAIAITLPHHASATPAIITDTTIIVGANSAGPYFVSGFFIMAGSETVSNNSNAELVHSLDPNAGHITFDRTLTPKDTVHVTFERLGFALKSQWARSIDRPDQATPGIVPVTYTAPVTAPSASLRSMPVPARLQWQGHKSFSVTASDAQSTDWSQGLELGVEGEIVEGLRLSAALSDRQVGQGSRYSSHGGSRLGDLDRYFIEARSESFQGRWGELHLDQTGMTSRRASGLQARLRTSQNTFESFVARPQGETRRTQIALRDGVLGPYTLSGSAAHANIVDGSQTVWLGREQLSEGADADYTIDQARGTLTLSPRVSFSREAQLIVEYEESLDDYQRTMAGGAWGWRSADSSVNHSFSLAWEGDDPSQPLFGSLADEQRDVLGNSPNGTVHLPAAERVGDYDGDYVVDISAEGDSVFTYAGPDQGDWDVRFQWVGVGKGSYRHLIDDVFEHVGAAAGQYAPTLILNAPASEAVIDETMRIASRRLGQFAINWLGIGLDPNRFSSGSSRFHSNHSLGWASSAMQSQSPNFAAVNWVRQRERAATHEFGLSLARFSNDWRLRGDLLDNAYDSYSLASGATPAKWLTLASTAERFEHSRLSGWRNSSSAEVQPNQWLTLEQHLNQRWVQGGEANESRSIQFQTRAKAQSGSLSAEAGWNTEDIDDATRLFTLETDANAAQWLSVSRNGLTARQEWRRSHDIDMNRDERFNEFSLGLPAKLLGGSSGSGLTALRGARSISGGESQPYYGGRLNSTWSVNSDLQVTASADLSHRTAGAQREVFIPTRPGQGDYRFERGEYIPDPQGDYRRVFVDDEDGAASAYDATKGIRINWRPNWQGWRWTIDASRRVDARYSASAFTPADWLLPWTEMATALMPGARLTLRDDHRLSVLPRTQSRITVLLAHEHQLFRSQSVNRDDNQRIWRVESEWREELNAKSYFAAGAQYHRRTRDGSPSASIDSDARALLTTFGITPVQGVGVSVEARRRLDREFDTDELLTLWGLRPSARVNLGALNGSVSTDFTWLDGDISGYISPLLSEGRPYGFSFTESLELRWQLPSRISLNARVSGDHRPNEPDRWRMHLETVATF